MSHKNAPPLTDEQMRFEIWYIRNAQRFDTIGRVAFGRDKDGKYLSQFTQLAWEAWKAASA